MFITIIAVHSIMIHWNTTAHIIILSPDNLTLYSLVNCQKQSIWLSLLETLASVLCCTFREKWYKNTTRDVQYTMTLKNIYTEYTRRNIVMARNDGL